MRDKKERHCFFCGISEVEAIGGLVEEDYYDPQTTYQYTVLGCKDKGVCGDRQIEQGKLPAYYKKSWER